MLELFSEITGNGVLQNAFKCGAFMSSLINQQCLKYSLVKKESILSADTGTSDILWDEKSVTGAL